MIVRLQVPSGFILQQRRAAYSDEFDPQGCSGAEPDIISEDFLKIVSYRVPNLSLRILYPRCNFPWIMMRRNHLISRWRPTCDASYQALFDTFFWGSGLYLRQG